MVDDAAKSREELLAELAGLRQTAARYRSLLDALPDAVSFTDMTGCITEASAQALRLFRGAGGGELVGRNAFEQIAPEDREIAQRNMQRTLVEGVVRGMNYTLLHADGTRYVGELNAALVRGPGGEPLGFIASIRDVTARRRAEEALRESEELFRALAERSPNMIFINQDGHVVYANDRCAEIMGYAKDELLDPAFDFRALTAPESAATVDAAFSRHARGEDVPPYEYALTTRNGGRLDAIIATRLLPFRGRPAILGIITDITERKRMATELQRADKLESLGVLAGGIAHDFNNTLAVIAGNASLGRRLAPPGSDLDQVLEDVERAALQGRRLTRQLLTFAKGGAPVKRRLSLGALVRETVELALSGSRIHARVTLPDDLWPVEVDEGQFVQVFNNLLLNAQQAMPDGGTIEVSGENLSRGPDDPVVASHGGRKVVVAVRDHGVGIPAAYRQRIFDPFFTTKPGGTGLGLSTVYSILRRHDARVEVESEVGAGSTFRVIVPAIEGPASDTQPVARPAPGPGHGRILVMDDEQQLRGVVGRYLVLSGYEVVLTATGEEMIDAFRDAMAAGRPFDAVIVDLTVPGGMGGKEALDRLRAIDPQVRAVVSSGYSEDPVLADYRGHGFRGALVKPYELTDLAEVLHAVLGS